MSCYLSLLSGMILYVEAAAGEEAEEVPVVEGTMGGLEVVEDVVMAAFLMVVVDVSPLDMAMDDRQEDDRVVVGLFPLDFAVEGHQEDDAQAMATLNSKIR